MRIKYQLPRLRRIWLRTLRECEGVTPVCQTPDRSLRSPTPTRIVTLPKATTRARKTTSPANPANPTIPYTCARQHRAISQAACPELASCSLAPFCCNSGDTAGAQWDIGVRRPRGRLRRPKGRPRRTNGLLRRRHGRTCRLGAARRMAFIVLSPESAVVEHQGRDVRNASGGVGTSPWAPGPCGARLH